MIKWVNNPVYRTLDLTYNMGGGVFKTLVTISKNSIGDLRISNKINKNLSKYMYCKDIDKVKNTAEEDLKEFLKTEIEKSELFKKIYEELENK